MSFARIMRKKKLRKKIGETNRKHTKCNRILCECGVRIFAYNLQNKPCAHTHCNDKQNATCRTCSIFVYALAFCAVQITNNEQKAHLTIAT